MTVLMAYDVDNQAQYSVKTALTKLGFSDFWKDSNGNTHYLPDTTLYHDKLKHVVEAKKLMKQVLDELNSVRLPDDLITVTYFVAAHCSDLRSF